MPTLSVVIPAYNEEAAISSIIERVLALRNKLGNHGISDIEVIVVNDGSRDATMTIAAGYRDIVLINHEMNEGYGAALKSGFRRARGELLSFLDADGTYPPELLLDFCQTLLAEDADIVLGSRFAGTQSNMSKVRYIGNTVFANLLSWIGGQKVSDAASGMRVFKKSILPQLYPLPDGLDFTPAMSTRAIHEGLKILEVPMSYHERVGQSKLSVVRDGLRFLRSIVSTTLLYNPLKFFGIVGLLMILGGLLIGIQPFIHFLLNRQVPEYFIYRLFVVLILFVAGANITSFGVLSNYTISIWHKRSPYYGRLERIIYNRYTYGYLDTAGLLLMIAGVALNIPSFYHYLTMRQVLVHWLYLFTGVMLLLVGLQLFTSSIMMKILGALNEREAKIKKDMVS